MIALRWGFIAYFAITLEFVGMTKRKLLIALTMVVSVAVARPQALLADKGARFVGGGPFHIVGDDVVGCADRNAVLIVNDPDRDRKYGRATVARALIAGRCDDFPEGTPVLVLGASIDIALIIPDVRGAVSARGVPASSVVNVLGEPIFYHMKTDFGMVPWSQASQFGH